MDLRLLFQTSIFLKPKKRRVYEVQINDDFRGTSY